MYCTGVNLAIVQVDQNHNQMYIYQNPLWMMKCWCLFVFMPSVFYFITALLCTMWGLPSSDAVDSQIFTCYTICIFFSDSTIDAFVWDLNRVNDRCVVSTYNTYRYVSVFVFDRNTFCCTVRCISATMPCDHVCMLTRLWSHDWFGLGQ